MEPIKAIRNRSVIEGDGIGAWSALKAEYETGSMTNKRKLIKQIHNMKMEGSLNTLSAYVYEFNKTMNTLASMGVEYQNDIKITMLLAGLRSEYKQVINILNMTPWLTYDEVYSQLKLFEENNNIDRKMARSFRGLSLNQTRSNRPRPRRQSGLSAQGESACPRIPVITTKKRQLTYTQKVKQQ